MNDNRRLYWVVTPDGTHLSDSKDTPGAKRALARDDGTNKLSGHAELIPADEDDDLWPYTPETDPSPSDDSGRLSPAQQVIRDVLTDVLTQVVDEVLIPLGKRWWAERGAPAVDRRLSRIAKKRRSALEQADGEAISVELAVPVVAPRVAPSQEIQAANDVRVTPMSSSEFKARLFEALTAQAILDEHLGVLSTARVQDEDLSPELSSAIRLVLEGNAASLESAETAALVRFLTEGRVLDGRYVLTEGDEYHEVHRLPSAES